MTRSFGIVSLCSLVVLASGCCKSGGDDKKPDEPTSSFSAPKTPATTDKTPATATASQSPPKPAEGQYPLSAIKTIPDNCSKAHVLMTTAPANEKNSYPWTWTRQAMIVHPEFKANTGKHPTIPGQVLFEMYDYGADGKAKALIAHCADGGTCNRLAAMYKAVVPSSRPQPMCGEPVGVKGSPTTLLMPMPGLGNEDDMPDSKDVAALCARLSVCMIHANPSTPGDPGIDCQKAPSKFKTQCALKTPCSAVMECAGK